MNRHPDGARELLKDEQKQRWAAYATEHNVYALMASITESIMVNMPEEPVPHVLALLSAFHCYKKTFSNCKEKQVGGTNRDRGLMADFTPAAPSATHEPTIALRGPKAHGTAIHSSNPFEFSHDNSRPKTLSDLDLRQRRPRATCDGRANRGDIWPDPRCVVLIH
jgi:hypothetical protein